jgi:hypothetical protein
MSTALQLHRFASRGYLHATHLLQLQGGQSLRIPHRTAYALSNYTIGLVIRNQGSFQFSKGAFNFGTADFSGLHSGRLYSIALNSSQLFLNGQQTATHTKNFNNTSDIVISGEADIAGLFVLDKNATASEIALWHRQPFLLPRSFSAYAVGHWHFKQSYYRKVNASGNQETQYGVGAVLAFDAVALYNPHKISALQSNHAILEGFSDAQLGIPLKAAAALMQGFYEKRRNYFHMFNPKGILRHDHTISGLTNQDISMILKVGSIPVDDGLYRTLLVNSYQPSHSYVEVHKDKIVSFGNVGGNSNIYHYFTPAELAEGANLSFTLLIKFTGGTTKSVYLKTNLDSEFWLVNTFVHTYNFAAVSQFRIGDSATNNLGIVRELVAKENIDFEQAENPDSIQNNLVLDLIYEETSDKQVYNRATDSSKNVPGKPTAELLEGGGAWLEQASGLPPVTQGLLIESGKTIPITYTNVVGYQLTLQLESKINTLSEVLSGVPALSTIYCNGNQLNSERELVTHLNSLGLCELLLLFNPTSGTFTLQHTESDYRLVRFGILSSPLSLTAHTNQYNQQDLKPPQRQHQAAYIAYYQCCEGNFTTSLVHPEIVPLLGSNNLLLQGWSGATAADKLADLRNHIDYYTEEL